MEKKKEQIELNGVKMLPFGILSGQVNGAEVRIIEASPGGFSFRVPELLDHVEQIKLHFYQFKRSEYETIQVEIRELLEPEREEFYYVYTVLVKKSIYQELLQNLVGEYSDYIDLKLAGDDGWMSQELTGYPAELEGNYFEDFRQQKAEWTRKMEQELADPSRKKRFQTLCQQAFTLCLSLDCPKAYEVFLKEPWEDYVADYWKQNGMSGHPLSEKPPAGIYVGNQFCHFLFPEERQLFLILDKAKKENLKVTLCLTYLRESKVDQQRALLQKVEEFSRENQTDLTLVVNDWGTLKLLEDMDSSLRRRLGILINKRRKDVRYRYNQSYQMHPKALKENNSNSPFYENYLASQWNINDYEYESCGYLQKIPAGSHSLHLPFYQTNTSQYCTLYAKCRYGDRGHQSMSETCPSYCSQKVFLYPKHLKLVGRYNSLFGYDAKILEDPAILEYYLNQGITQLVMNWM